MKRPLAAFAAGALFAVGLGVSGMTLPSKVIGFLDVTGDWDPSLAFVMVGAIGVYAAFLRLFPRRAAPPSIAASRPIDRRLIAGAALFGIGWGLSGYCPGPALTSLVTLTAPALIFVGAMVMGMWLQQKTAGVLSGER